MAARKHYTFRVKVDVDACAPDELDFEANVTGGSFDVDAATVTTTVKRAKGAKACPSPPLPSSSPSASPSSSPSTSPATNACTSLAVENVDGKDVYTCGKLVPCGAGTLVPNLTDAIECVAACLRDTPTTIYVSFRKDIQFCKCSVTYDAGVELTQATLGYAIGQNPATLNIVGSCPR